MKLSSQHYHIFRIIFISIAIVVGVMIFGGETRAQTPPVTATTPAATTANASGDSISGMIFEALGALLNLLYMITLPILIIAGKAIDNSMVYGEFINLDKILYMLHNFSRTFANFAIGAVLLRKILQYVFTEWSGKSPDFLKTIIIKGVATALAVNFAWFGLGALFDLSTIATYSLGSLPLGVLKETQSQNNMPILTVATYFNFKDNNATTAATPPPTNQTSPGTFQSLANHTYYTRGSINIPMCAVLNDGLIIGPVHFPNIPNTSIYFTGNNIGNYATQTNIQQYCALSSTTLVDITALERWKYENFSSFQASDRNKDRNDAMKDLITHVKGSDPGPATIQSHTIAQTDITTLFNTIMIAGDGQINNKTYRSGDLKISKNAYHTTTNNRQQGFMMGGNNDPYSEQNGLTLHSLIERSKGMVGPFVTLYVSLLDYSNMNYTDSSSAAGFAGGFMDFLLKALVSIALFIPLVALAIVLIVRVVILRGVIAFIPLGIVFALLGDQVGLEGKGNIKMGSMLGELNAKSVIGLIFAPILPVFAISISIIILHTLQLSMKQAVDQDSPFWNFMGITSEANQNASGSCVNFRGVSSYCMDAGEDMNPGSGFANFLPWLFLNIFGIGLMWMMLKFSLSGSKITADLGGKIMDLGAQALGSIPIVPIGGGKSVGLGSVMNAPSMLETAGQRRINERLAEDDQKLQEQLGIVQPRAPNTGSGSYTPDQTKKITESLSNTTTKTLPGYIDSKTKALTDHVSKEESERFKTSGITTLGGQISKLEQYLSDDKDRKNIKPEDKIKHAIDSYIAGNKDNNNIQREDKTDDLIKYINTMKAPKNLLTTIGTIQRGGKALNDLIAFKDDKFIKKTP